MKDDARQIYERVLLAAQGALLGEIYPEIVAIATGYDPERFELLLRYYLDRPPVDADYESISVAVSEIISDFTNGSAVFKSFREECVFCAGGVRDIPTLRAAPYERLVFQRKSEPGKVGTPCPPQR